MRPMTRLHALALTETGSAEWPPLRDQSDSLSILGASATLNQDYDKAATEMFRRLAHEPGLSLAGTPTGVLAVMCWRIAKLIKLVRDRPDRLPESDLLFDDVEARAFLFEQVLGSVSLPAEQHGKLLIDESPGLVH